MGEDDEDEGGLDAGRPPINWGLAEVPPDTIASMEIEAKKVFLENLWMGQGSLAAGLQIGWSPQHIDVVMRDPEIAALVKLIEEGKDQNMEMALYRTGLTGNVTAQQVWLYNRRPEQWRDTKRTIVSVEGKMQVDVVHSVVAAARQLIQSEGIQALQPGGALDVIDIDDDDT